VAPASARRPYGWKALWPVPRTPAVSRLACYQIACCAADAVAAVVRVVGVAGDPPALDTWVIVTGTFRRSSDDVPELVASSLVQIPPPVDPYES